MYDDPKDIRDHEIKVRVKEETYAMIRALARDSGTQVATLAHELVMQGVRAMLAEHHAGAQARKEVQKKALKITGARYAAHHAGRADGRRAAHSGGRR